MGHFVKLEPDHCELIDQALDRSLEYKRDHVVRNQTKIEETRRQYEDAKNKFGATIKIAQTSNNIFTWLADQIRHSGPLQHQELGRRVLDICEVCVKNRYDDYISDRGLQFDRLFQENDNA